MLRVTLIVLTFYALACAHTIDSGKRLFSLIGNDSVSASTQESNSYITSSATNSEILPLVFRPSTTEAPLPHLTGVLSEDLFASTSGSGNRDTLEMLKTRAALKAGFFSLVVPGTGQLYNGGTANYIKAAAFFGLEAAGWIVNVLWNKKGSQETKSFQVYADGTAADGYRNGHYSVYRYAQWIGDNVQQLEQINGTSTQGQAIIAQYINANGNSLLGSQYATPQYQVNWYALNQVENAMGGYFSHWLFAYPGVEYYKEIGKYPQFRQGWIDENPAILDYNSIRIDTPDSYFFENMRGTATHYYNVALVAAGVLILNHFASGVEAALWAHSNYKPIETRIDISPLPQGMGYQTDFDLALNF